MASKTAPSYHPQPPPRAGKKPLSLLAQYDDLVRNANALSNGDEEGECALIPIAISSSADYISLKMTCI